MLKNIIFFGPPGCGKGTQADLLVKTKNYFTVSTGFLLREIVNSGSELGKNIASILSSGDLVSDDIVNKLVDEFYTKNKMVQAIILDGYPRSLSQAKSLDIILKNHSTEISKVFYFDVSEDIIVKRVTGRYSCSNCGAVYNTFFLNTVIPGECDKCHSHNFSKRSDDSEEIIINRLNVFKESTYPLLEFYKSKLVRINAEQDTSSVLQSILNNLDN